MKAVPKDDLEKKILSPEEQEELLKDALEQEPPEEEPEWDIFVEGTINYKIFVSEDGHYRHEASTTMESELVMILDCINAMNRMKAQWPRLENMAKYHENKKIRQQAKLSSPSVANKIAIGKAVYELEKIRDSFMRTVIEKHRVVKEHTEE